MVPAHSIKVSRVSMYSGFRHVIFPFAYGAFTLSGRLSQNLSARINESIMRSEPRNARIPVWPLSISLAATLEIDVSFSSSGYLDVSVHRVPLHTLWIGVWIHEVFSCGFPHSEICGSMDICSLPQLIAAYHVFHRLLVPRHPPCALFCLTTSQLAPLLFGRRVRLPHRAARLLLFRKNEIFAVKWLTYSVMSHHLFNSKESLLFACLHFSDVLIISEVVHLSMFHFNQSLYSV